MMNFTFELTEQQAQKVLNALVKEPYGEVVEVINTVQSQAAEQLNSSQKSSNDFYEKLSTNGTPA